MDYFNFAIANAAALVLGYEPGKFFFDQSAMRTHLKVVLKVAVSACFL